MRSISFYVDKRSLIHQVDPITKLLYIMVAIAIPFILPTIEAALICAIISLLLLMVAGVWKRSLTIFGFILFVLMTIIIIQGLFYVKNATPLLSIGPLIFYQEGLLFALRITFRVINIVGAFLLLILTTKPSDLVDSLVRRGLSPRLGYVCISIFQIIPQMISTMETIMDAQRSRGLETEGNIFVRIKAFLPLLGPVVLHSLIQTKERAMALEVRGFNATSERSYLYEEKRYAQSRWIRVILLLLLLSAIIWRVIS